METPHEMTTVAQVLEKLRVKKMDNEFRYTEEGFTAGKGKVYQPEDLEITKVFRFEGPSDPSDMSIVYIIEAKDGLQGYSLDAYGTYSEHEAGYDNFIRQVSVKGHEEQLLFEL
ncbi:hypothetical protein SAMN05421788_106120 [Filimonas lacunae]|uniref:Phosphoribosylpyrophosphate synthetase n=1 Tax=Filimonas lacunae TaxID=477680 RepID=A0A173MF48_9BACT|nr:hypothetical protein [Filimonas lacunae]BAV06051.1 hypothetical protein FLA_2066 [Filimonas lacunae]SIT24415.1 hypothetical protein SAMN05421788_106120 [Filimonas lacunae]